MRIGALEGGGTKMVLAVCNELGAVIEREEIPTKEPAYTMPAMIDYFRKKKVDALGIGFFGPIQVNRKSPEFGCVTSTPKLAWRNYPVYKEFEEALGIPIGLDTDVNASALGEASFGASKGLENSIYLTVGTGIGVGVIANGRVLHGMQHPEGGHVLLKARGDDSYSGKCPYHGCCLEGMASGPAIEERWGLKGQELSEREEVWELEAYYLAQGLIDMIYLLAPERIVFGGGVMKQKQLLPLIRAEVKKQLGGYMITRELEDIESYIVEAALGGDQGIIGCAELGRQAIGLVI